MAVFRDNRADQLSAGRRMESVANYWTDSGQVVCTTTTINYVMFAGYTGGVAIAFVGNEGRTIGTTDVQQFGVDGTSYWWLQSKRTDIWKTYADPNGFPEPPTAIVCLHGHAPRNRLVDIVTFAVQVAEPVVVLLGKFKGAT